MSQINQLHRLKRGRVVQQMYREGDAYRVGRQLVARQPVDLQAEYKAWATRERHLDAAGNLKPGRDPETVGMMFLDAMVAKGMLEEKNHAVLIVMDRTGITNVEED